MRQYWNIPEDRKDEFFNLQIDSWRKRAELLQAIKPIIRTYDGKTYNKRFDKAIEDKYNTKEDRDNYIFVSHSYGERIYIGVNCKRALTIQNEHYANHCQINDHETTVMIALTTPEGAKLRRIDSKGTIENIDSRINELHEKIDHALRAYANLKAYREKINEVNRILKEAADLIGNAPSEFTGLYKTEYTLKESRY